MDVSIEYAHIYSNQHIGEEHRLSLDILGDLGADARSASLVVLVDDYSFPDPSFDYTAFTAWLAESGYKPDLVFRESQLIPLCDEVLGMVTDHRLRGQIEDYVKEKKYPCSLFIASWYLLRLGKLVHPAFKPEFSAKRLINILPTSFKPFEDKALEIIGSAGFGESVPRIEYRFFEGRLIA